MAAIRHHNSSVALPRRSTAPPPGRPRSASLRRRAHLKMGAAVRTACVLSVAVLALAVLPAAADAFVTTGDGSWYWLNPLPQGNTLRGVQFIDASRGWAVGDGGTIITTANGGTTWNSGYSTTSADLHAISFADAEHGWAVGAGGAIQATTDAGISWKAQDSLTTATLNGVAFGDVRDGYAVGGSTIRATTDGGATWAVQWVGGSDLNAVACSGATRAWAVGKSGTIVATTNGGAAWNKLPSPLTTDLYAVDFFNATHGWAVGASGAILVCSDGATWTRQTSGTPLDLNGVAFADATHGWAGGADGIVLMTSDGGTTWTRKSGFTNNDVMAVDFTAIGHSWAVGAGGAIGTTTANGWQSQTTGQTRTGDMAAVAFAGDQKHGWVVGNNPSGRIGEILSTSDGGAHWQSHTWVNLRFTDVTSAYGNTMKAWATDEYDDSVYATTDGGATWTMQYAGAPYGQPWWQAIVFANDNLHGWAVGYDPYVLSTTDGGANWVFQCLDQSVGSTIGFYDVATDGHSRCWAVGRNGLIMATTDGVTWFTQRAGTDIGNNLKAVDFINSRGWAVGDRGTILATTDGGTTWAAQNSGTTRALLGVQFYVVLVPTSPPKLLYCGWACGYNGTIVATTDGGAHWLPQRSGTTAPLRGLCFVGSANGWTVGDHGTIMATSTGGLKPQDRTPPTTTAGGADDLWHDHAVTVMFTAHDNPGGSGVARTEWQVDDGAWTTGTVCTIDAPSTHANDGVRTIGYRSVDIAGNVETRKTCTLRIDTAAPSAVGGLSSATHPDEATWYANGDPSFAWGAASDAGSGVVGYSYVLDQTAATEPDTGTEGVSTSASFTGKADGVWYFHVRAVDGLGHGGPTSTRALRIDTQGPTTVARARCSVISGRRATFKYRVNDPVPGSPTARVTIKVKKRSGATVKTLKPGVKNTNANLTYRWTCKLKKGTYRWWIYATDAAGNVQAKIGKGYLTVN